MTHNSRVTVIATAIPSVSSITRWGGLGGLFIKLWMNLTKHTLHAHAFDQKSIGFSLFGLTLNNLVRAVSGTPVWDGSFP